MNEAKTLSVQRNPKTKKWCLNNSPPQINQVWPAQSIFWYAKRTLRWMAKLILQSLQLFTLFPQKERTKHILSTFVLVLRSTRWNQKPFASSVFKRGGGLCTLLRYNFCLKTCCESDSRSFDVFGVRAFGGFWTALGHKGQTGLLWWFLRVWLLLLCCPEWWWRARWRGLSSLSIGTECCAGRRCFLCWHWAGFPSAMSNPWAYWMCHTMNPRYKHSSLRILECYINVTIFLKILRPSPIPSFIPLHLSAWCGFFYLLETLDCFCFVMDKGENPLTFAKMIISDNTKGNITKAEIENQSVLGNTNSPKLPNPVPTSPKTKNQHNKMSRDKPTKATKQFDPKALFNKLAATRVQAKKQKELTLIGFLVGEQVEFPRLMAKLRMEWRTAKGDILFSSLKSGWFEIAFSNQIDFNRVWEGRPYHVFSQLLLLKQWYCGFDPSKESISQLDLWVRLHFMPEEYANPVALEVIIEDNLVGTFIKMDPTHNKNRMNMFTRFCVNTDVAINVGKKIIIPDEECNLVKYKMWFDDFPDGCGACGKADHEFQMCPNRATPIPTLRIKIRKSSSQNFTIPKNGASSSAEPGWNTMGKNNRVTQEPYVKTNTQVKPYLGSKSGVDFIYISDDSEDSMDDNEDLEAEFDNSPPISFAKDNIHDTAEKDGSPGKISPTGMEGQMIVETVDELHKHGKQKQKEIPLEDPISREPEMKGRYEWGSSSNINATIEELDEFGIGLKGMEEEPITTMQQNYIMDTNLPAETNLPPCAMIDVLRSNSKAEFFSPPLGKQTIGTMVGTEDMVVDPPEMEEGYEAYEQGYDDEENYYVNEEGDMFQYEEENEEGGKLDQIREGKYDDKATNLAHQISEHGRTGCDDNQVKENEMSLTSSSKRKNKECMEDTASSGLEGNKKFRK